MRKKVDSRIRTLVENCVKLKQRGLLVVIGDKGRDQVVNLHYMLSKASVKARPSVLWCYKKDLYFSSHTKKRMRQVKKMMQRGLLDAEKEDPFSLFVASTSIRYCFYHETQNILGNTFGMCVLQDFEALTPNLLARTVETVEGGGLVVLLLSSLKSLTQLYSLTMDVHSRLRTESHQDVTGRFNERLVLSLAGCPHTLMMDDELNVLPTSTLIQYIEPLPMNPDGTLVNDPTRAGQAELKELAESLADTQPAGALVARCKTLDQARAVVTFLDAASEKTLRSTVALTAARGRGKSAALGLAIAGALGLGYSNIFVTAPSPENLQTLFQFIFKGLDGLGYKEHIDYDLVQSTNPAFGKAVIRVNVFRNHRQTVQYIQPQHHSKLAQAELLVIDEAAAIPLPVVKALLGPYLVFLCSTVNGYEGTGRSLSLKLIQQLREQGAKLASSAAAAAAATGVAVGKNGAAGSGSVGGGAAGRTFREVTLNEPIRYAPGDPIESWLHELLCLDSANHVPRPPARLPHPSECELFYVERDTLFSYHKASERFLQGMVSLYTSSHYRNQPNDLILMSDAPAHHLFVLLGPVNQELNVLPDILCVVQVALEGAISKKAAAANLGRGDMPQGDLIPWTVGQQFQDSDFVALSGARIVRIAVHPDMGRAGYGTRAVELLRRYYQGEMTSLADEDSADEDAAAAAGGKASTSGRGADANGAAGGSGKKAGRKAAKAAAAAAEAAAAEEEEEEEEGAKSASKSKKRARAAAAAAAAGEGEEDDDEDEEDEGGAAADGSTLLTEKMKPRVGLPPLLVNLADRPPERLHYLGVSYGLTQQLFNFWRRAGFEPLYLRQSASDTTGEHTTIMVAPLRSPDVEGTAWLAPFVADFKARFTSLLAGAFRTMPPALALSILDPQLTFSEAETQRGVREGAVVLRGDGVQLSPHDLKRLQAYASNLVDYHLILDLLPGLAAAYFSARLPAALSYGQAAILLCLGLQQRELSEVEELLNLPSNQVLALFNKAIRKLHSHLRSAKEAAVDRSLPRPKGFAAPGALLQPHAVGLDEEMDDAAAAVRAKLKEALQPEDLARYAIRGGDEDLQAAASGRPLTSGGIITVRGGAAPAGGDLEEDGDAEPGSAGKGKGGKGGAKGDMLYKKKDKKQYGSGGGGKQGGGSKSNKKQRS